MLQLVGTALAGRGTASINFQETKLCEGGGLVLLNGNGVTGMARPQILSCVPSILKTVFQINVSFTMYAIAITVYFLSFDSRIAIQQISHTSN